MQNFFLFPYTGIILHMNFPIHSEFHNYTPLMSCFSLFYAIGIIVGKWSVNQYVTLNSKTMKKLFSILCLSFLVSTAISQTRVGTVTVNVTGNRNKQVAVDGKTYTVTNTDAAGEQAIVINDLANGQHSLEIFRTNVNNRTTSNKTTFTLRQGYDLTITVSSNGSVSQAETRITTGWGNNNNNNNNSAINTAAFNKLYTQVKSKTSSTARSTYLENEFNTTRKMFTASQASQLIQLVNSESLRLKLARLSYTKISDPANFSLVRNLLNSTANKTALDNYIATLPADNDDTDEGVALTDERFKVIYNEVINEPTQSDRNYYLNNFFDKDFNLYTSTQARQLIGLVTSETERFYLSKIAYRGVTDKANYYNQVYPLLSYSSNRTDLMTYINSYNNNNTGTGTGVAMTSTDFNRLYNSVYSQSSVNRYATVNTTFTATGNYFTTAQARQLIQLVNNESNRLALSKAAYRVLVDRTNYTQLSSLLTLQASRNDLDNYVANYNLTGTGTGVAMSEYDFNQLYTSISNAWSASTRVNLSSTAFQNTNNYFTTVQVRQILLLINTEADRLTLAKSAYDNITDQSSYSQLYDVFSTSASKNELAKFIGDSQYGGVVIKTPMTETEFNSLVRNIQFTFGIGAKMSALTDVFNKETNYFTVQQAKQLIQLVSAENNRLELAKSAYNNITDPGNFTQLYDIFSSQTSKDELSAYVGSNASLLR